MDGMEYLKDYIRRLSHSLNYVLIGFISVVSSRWTWMGLVFITILSLWRCRTRRSNKRRKSSSLCNSVETMDNCIEAASAWFLLTKMMFIQKSSSLSVAKSAPSHSTFREKELESAPTSDQQLDYLPRNLIRQSKQENLCPADEFRGSERRSINDPVQDSRGKITISSDCVYDMGWNNKCKGSLFRMNDDEGGGRRQLGPCLLHNCADLGVWPRVESSEIQFGWDRLLSLRLDYDWNWNCNTGESGLNLDKFSRYPLRFIDVANVLESPKRRIAKLLSRHEDAVTSDMSWAAGLSCTCTIDNTVRLWDIEVGKSLNKMMVNDYATVGCDVGNNPGLLLKGIMMREEKGSFFVWDPRDFQRPLNFCVGNMSTLHSVHFKDNKVSVSDCFGERQFDLRRIAACSTKFYSFTDLHCH